MRDKLFRHFRLNEFEAWLHDLAVAHPCAAPQVLGIAKEHLEMLRALRKISSWT